jgi:hypothetical protein
VGCPAVLCCDGELRPEGKGGDEERSAKVPSLSLRPPPHISSKATPRPSYGPLNSTEEQALRPCDALEVDELLSSFQCREYLPLPSLLGAVPAVHQEEYIVCTVLGVESARTRIERGRGRCDGSGRCWGSRQALEGRQESQGGLDGRLGLSWMKGSKERTAGERGEGGEGLESIDGWATWGLLGRL